MLWEIIEDDLGLTEACPCEWVEKSQQTTRRIHLRLINQMSVMGRTDDNQVLESTVSNHQQVHHVRDQEVWIMTEVVVAHGLALQLVKDRDEVMVQHYHQFLAT
jgi:hypothetical protein